MGNQSGKRESYDFHHGFLLDFGDPIYLDLTMPKAARHIIRIAVTGVEKRYKPTRHYVYILQVKWSDNSEYVIYRAYSDFYEFHITLLELFPKEAGSVADSERILPYLPGRKLFSRTEVQRVASKRQVTLEGYCKELLSLPFTITQCPHVHSFFKADTTDISPPEDSKQKPAKASIVKTLMPFLGKDEKLAMKDGDDLSISGPMVLEQYTVIADYVGSSRREVDLVLGQIVDVLEKHDNGWWFVQTEDGQGWAPASYLDPMSQIEELDEPDPDFQGKKFISTNEYEAQLDDEVSFPCDAMVLVMHQLLDGWWIVRYGDKVGYAPSAYLLPYNNPHLRKLTVIQRSRTNSNKIIPRRCTISSSTKRPILNRPQRDLSVYRKSIDKAAGEKDTPDKAIYVNTRRHDSGIYENDSDRSRGNTTNSDDPSPNRERTETSATCHSLEEQEDYIDMDGDQPSYEYIDDFVGGEPGTMTPNTSTNCQTGSDSENEVVYEYPADYYDFNADEYDDTLDDADDEDYDDVNPGVTSLPVCKPGDRLQRSLNDDSGSSSCSLESHVPFKTAREKFSAPHPPASQWQHPRDSGAAKGSRPGPGLRLNTTAASKNHLKVPKSSASRSGSSGSSPNTRSPDSGIALSQNAFNTEIKARLAKLNVSTSNENKQVLPRDKDISSNKKPWLPTGQSKQLLPPPIPKAIPKVGLKPTQNHGFNHHNKGIVKPRSQSNAPSKKLSEPEVEQRPKAQSDAPLSIHDRIAMFQASS